jgi:hypothetical protein
MGRQCYHVVHLGLLEPVSLRPSQKEDVCDKCREVGYTLADVPQGIVTADSSASTLAEGEDEWLTQCGKEVAYIQGPILWCQECMDLFRSGEFPRVCEPWDSDTTPPEQRHDELLRAARVLLEAGITDEGKIIPTLAFAARLWEIRYLRHIRDWLVDASEEPERWGELKEKFMNTFHPFEPMEAINGVLQFHH